MIPVEVPAEVRALWDRVPKMKDCKGECDTSCGPTPAAPIEHDLIEVAAGKEALRTEDGVLGAMTCSLLKDGKCEVYTLRPLMCRVWGTVPSLQCPYGCQPERWMTDAEVFEIIIAMTNLTGHPPGAEMDIMLKRMPPEIQELWHREIGDVAKAAARSGKPVEWRERTE